MRSSPFLLALSVAIAAAACSTDQQAVVTAPSFAKGGGGGGGGGGVQDPTATFSIPNTAGISLQGDGLGNYVNGSCTVETHMYATTAYSNSGDVIMTMTAPSGRKCGRVVTLVYPDGSAETLPVAINLLKLQNTDESTWIPIGATSSRRLIVSPQAVSGAGSSAGRCGRLVFGENGGVAVGSNPVRVTRLDTSTWRVQSDPDANLAYCELQNENVAMTVDFTVTASQNLPPVPTP